MNVLFSKVWGSGRGRKRACGAAESVSPLPAHGHENVSLPFHTESSVQQAAGEQVLGARLPAAEVFHFGLPESGLCPDPHSTSCGN